MYLVMFHLWYSIQQMLKQGLTCSSSFCPEFQRLIIKLLVGNPIVFPRGTIVGMHPNPSVPPLTQVEVLELLCQTFAGNPGVMLLLTFAYHPALAHLRSWCWQKIGKWELLDRELSVSCAFPEPSSLASGRDEGPLPLCQAMGQGLQEVLWGVGLCYLEGWRAKSDSHLGVQRQEACMGLFLPGTECWELAQRQWGVCPLTEGQWRLCPKSVYKPYGSQQDWAFSRDLSLEGRLEGWRGLWGWKGESQVVMWRQGIASIGAASVYNLWGSTRGISRKRITKRAWANTLAS